MASKSPKSDPLQALIGHIVRCYTQDKRGVSDGWHYGKLLKISKNRATIDLEHHIVVPITDVKEA